MPRYTTPSALCASIDREISALLSRCPASGSTSRCLTALSLPERNRLERLQTLRSRTAALQAQQDSRRSLRVPRSSRSSLRSLRRTASALGIQ